MTPIRPWSISGRLQTQSTMRKLFQVKMPRALMFRSSDCAENSPDANTHALCVNAPTSCDQRRGDGPRTPLLRGAHVRALCREAVDQAVVERAAVAVARRIVLRLPALHVVEERRAAHAPGEVDAARLEGVAAADGEVFAALREVLLDLLDAVVEPPSLRIAPLQRSAQHSR